MGNQLYVIQNIRNSELFVRWDLQILSFNSEQEAYDFIEIYSITNCKVTPVSSLFLNVKNVNTFWDEALLT